MSLRFVSRYVVAAMLWLPAAQAGADKPHPLSFVKDSAITAEIKARLATRHFSSLTKIKVVTDRNGEVWLRGSAASSAAADEAMAIARRSKGVKAVHNELRVKHNR